MRLQRGESHRVCIAAADRWTAAGVHVVAGERFDLAARGEWWDAGIRTGPDGFPTGEAPWYSRLLLRAFERWRRQRKANWFALIGSIDRRPDLQFVIGSSVTGWAAPADGELTCFANDHPRTYGNNTGAIELLITRVS